MAAPVVPWRTDPAASGLWADAVGHLTRADRAMGRLIEQVGPCTLAPTGLAAPFEAIAETIVYQQLTGKAAATIFGRFKALFDGAVEPAALIELGESRMKRAGLSSPKIRALHDLACRTLDRSLPIERLAELGDDELASALQLVKGIGPWSVQMILIFRLGRPDVWPVCDLGVRKGARRVWGLPELPEATELARRGERLRPHRTVAAWYLWRSLEIPEDRWRPTSRGRAARGAAT